MDAEAVKGSWRRRCPPPAGAPPASFRSLSRKRNPFSVPRSSIRPGGRHFSSNSLRSGSHFPPKAGENRHPARQNLRKNPDEQRCSRPAMACAGLPRVGPSIPSGHAGPGLLLSSCFLATTPGIVSDGRGAAAGWIPGFPAVALVQGKPPIAKRAISPDDTNHRRAGHESAHRPVPAAGFCASTGMRRPWRRAQASASGQPASAWRRMPSPGSQRITRPARRPAASVPSTTVTCPA